MLNSDAYLKAILADNPVQVADYLDRRTSLVEQPWEDAYRPLHWAALYGCARVVELLLDRGANVLALVEVPREPCNGDSNVWYDHQMRQIRHGWSARDMAVHANCLDIAARLERAGAPCRVFGPGPNPEWWQGVAAGYRRSSR